MAAVAHREESTPEAFVGQVLSRASPILTWRPALAARAERERVAAQNPQELSMSSVLEASEPSFRFSRAPTRKMIAWPVQKRFRRETARREARRTIALVAVGFVFVVSLVLGLLAACRAWQARGVARAEAPVARVVVTHQLDESLDVLAAPAAPAAMAPAPAAQPAPHKAARPPTAQGHRGRAHHGHRPTTPASH